MLLSDASGDALRPLILHAQGGMYLDLDVVSLLFAPALHCGLHCGPID